MALGRMTAEGGEVAFLAISDGRDVRVDGHIVRRHTRTTGPIGEQLPLGESLGFPYGGSLIVDPWLSPDRTTHASPSDYGFERVPEGPTTAWRKNDGGVEYVITDAQNIWSATYTPGYSWVMWAMGADGHLLDVRHRSSVVEYRVAEVVGLPTEHHAEST